MTIHVALNNVSLSYGQHVALRNVTLALEAGKIYGLLGRNGAGKTSLLSLLASYREPSEGMIRINGEIPFENAAVMRDVVLVYDRKLDGETEKVRGMLEAVERYRPNYDKAYADALVKRFNLPLDKAVNELSKGQQSALHATIGLSSRAPLTIFDEAYLGMDAPTREIFYQELLEDHGKHPRTIIISTHLVSEMDYLFEEVIVLHKGEIVLHEDYETIVSRGASVTGHAEAVDMYASGMKRLSEKQLGHTKSVMIYGQLGDEKRRDAGELGLEIGTVSLQDLFIHLTEEVDRA